MLKVQDYTQRELKLFHILSLIFYYIVTFVFPVIYAICVVTVTKEEIIITKTKFPIIAVIIVILVLIAGIKLLEKSIDKIQVLNLDGTYNAKAMTTKNILSFVVKALPAIIILAAVIIGGYKLNNVIDAIGKEAIEKVNDAVANAKQLVSFYVKFVGHLLSFYCVGVLINKTLVYQLEYELDLRNKVAEQSAIQQRINNLTNINK